MEFLFGKWVGAAFAAFILWWIGNYVGLKPDFFDGVILVLVCYLMIDHYWSKRGWL